jgi:glucose/arabinose dehydrogenase
MMKSCVFFVFLLIMTACGNLTKEQITEPGALRKRTENAVLPAITRKSAELPINSIKLPKGFVIEIYAEVENARSMALSPSGTLFVGNRGEDKVYAVQDTDGDFKADKKFILASGLKMPNGVAFKDGDLYIAEKNKISKISKVESNLSAPPSLQVVYDKFPTDDSHGWKYIAFGPDGKLYVPVGAPCNICEPSNPVYASITRMNPDGTGFEIFASGIRNTVGLTWHPVTKNIWFTDNGRDRLGDDVPPCELNTATQKGQHFGYPYCHGGLIKDPEFGNKRPCSDFVKPVQALGAHVAPLGLKFYTGGQFPAEYKNQVFIAEHGSWDRSRKVGHRLVLVNVDDNGKASSYDTFASGWLDETTQKVWGRPVDMIQMKDGSMLVSDDYADVIYRISYRN